MPECVLPEYLLVEVPAAGVTAKKVFDQLNIIKCGTLQECMAELIVQLNGDTFHLSQNGAYEWYEDGDLMSCTITYGDYQYQVKYIFMDIVQ